MLVLSVGSVGHCTPWSKLKSMSDVRESGESFSVNFGSRFMPATGGRAIVSRNQTSYVSATSSSSALFGGRRPSVLPVK
jgi:hypothetical protein